MIFNVNRAIKDGFTNHQINQYLKIKSKEIVKDTIEELPTIGSIAVPILVGSITGGAALTNPLIATGLSKLGAAGGENIKEIILNDLDKYWE